MQFEGLRKDMQKTEDEWSGVFQKLEASTDGVGVSAEINNLINQESALKAAISGVTGEMKAEHAAAITEFVRLIDQEKMLLNEVFEHADRYKGEEYTTVLRQIKGVHERRLELEKQIDATFETLT